MTIIDLWDWVCIPQGQDSLLAVDNSLHEGNLRGSGFITVDNPVMIAMYLQFILPLYPLGTIFHGKFNCRRRPTRDHVIFESE